MQLIYNILDEMQCLKLRLAKKPKSALKSHRFKLDLKHFSSFIKLLL